jgi:hypothetical protein
MYRGLSKARLGLQQKLVLFLRLAAEVSLVPTPGLASGKKRLVPDWLRNRGWFPYLDELRISELLCIFHIRGWN